MVRDPRKPIGRPKKQNTGNISVQSPASSLASSLYDSLNKAKVVKSDFISYNEKDPPPKDFLSTGLSKLDADMGGGLPVGKIVEVFGPNASGKSTLGYTFAKSCQDAGGLVLSIDTEHSWDQDRFEEMGGKRDRIVRSEADTLQEVFELIWKALKNHEGQKEYMIILVDTVAQVPTQDELEALLSGRELAGYGTAKSKYLSYQMRMLPRYLGTIKACLVFINQVRQNLKTVGFGGDPWIVPGGEAIKFAASSRIKVLTKGTVKEGDEVIGQKVMLETVKCKTAPPKRKNIFNLIYATGKFDQLSSIKEALLQRKDMKKVAGKLKMSEEVQQRFGFPEKVEKDELDALLNAQLNDLLAYINPNNEQDPNHDNGGEEETPSDDEA